MSYSVIFFIKNHQQDNLSLFISAIYTQNHGLFNPFFSENHPHVTNCPIILFIQSEKEKKKTQCIMVTFMHQKHTDHSSKYANQAKWQNPCHQSLKIAKLKKQNLLKCKLLGNNTFNLSNAYSVIPKLENQNLLE